MLRSFGRTLTVNHAALDCIYSFLSPPLGFTLHHEIKRLIPSSLLEVDVKTLDLNIHNLPLLNTSLPLNPQRPTFSFNNFIDNVSVSNVPLSLSFSGGLDSTFLAHIYGNHFSSTLP